MKHIFKNTEKNKLVRNIEIIISILLLIGMSISFINGFTSVGLSLLMMSISIFVILFFSSCFSVYEKIWFISILLLSNVLSIIFPEEEANGVNGFTIMTLYLFDTFLNILCELLISKQSRYNFIISIFIELIEIITCIVLMYRFATLAVTLLFWIPIDIISFIMWSKHKDEKQEELTIVRKLSGWQELLVIIGIIAWTIIVGYIISGLNIYTGFIKDNRIETIIIYLDACVSAVGVANGLFILFRLREQWIAWYIYSIIDSIINILSGQYVLLALKLGFLINTTYGYIKWTKYIKNRDKMI